jgi:hypothetical protein
VSQPAEISSAPPGCQASAGIRSECPAIVATFFTREVPNVNQAIFARGGNLAVTEVDRGNTLAVRLPLRDKFAVRTVPPADHPVFMADGKQLAVERKIDRHCPQIDGQASLNAGARGVPDIDEFFAGGAEPRRIRVERTDGIKVGQDIPSQQPAFAGPLTEDARFLDRPERIVGGVTQPDNLTLRVKQRLAIGAIDERRSPAGWILTWFRPKCVPGVVEIASPGSLRCSARHALGAGWINASRRVIGRFKASHEWALQNQQMCKCSVASVRPRASCHFR